MKNLAHLGNEMLHKNKSVMVEGGKFPRAHVMDAQIFDRYLMRNLLNLSQHIAAEYLFTLAARSGCWATGVDWASAGGTGGKRDYAPRGGFSGALRRIQEELSWAHAHIVKLVVIDDFDVSGDEVRLKCLRQGLDFVAFRRMMPRHDRLKALRK